MQGHHRWLQYLAAGSLCAGMCAAKLKLQPGDEGYEAMMHEACDEMLKKLADALQALYQRHRHVVGWGPERPLIIH